MTIREHFERYQTRLNYTVVIAAICMVAVPLGLFPIDAPTWAFAAFPAMVALILMFAINPLVKRVRFCPRCGADFRAIASPIGSAFRRKYWERWDRCPQCGVSFDAPYETISG